MAVFRCLNLCRFYLRRLHFTAAAPIHAAAPATLLPASPSPALHPAPCRRCCRWMCNPGAAILPLFQSAVGSIPLLGPMYLR